MLATAVKEIAARYIFLLTAMRFGATGCAHLKLPDEKDFRVFLTPDIPPGL